jgi:hypothetical protein
MAKKSTKITKKTRPTQAEINTEKLVDKSTRVLQLLSLLAVVVLLILRGTIENFEVETYVLIGLMGLAVGLNPEQIRKILSDVLKSFIGKK